ncbi:MAG: hypothetical protein LBM98_04340 [Oscillospiraceae bacterium]|nr:hypothetical protein [Oscillospiraceae bacterium]
MRYVGRYRCEAIQCRGDNIRPTSNVSQNTTSTLDCFAAYHQLRIASAAAASQRRAGRSPALSRRNAPGRWTGLRRTHKPVGAGFKPALPRAVRGVRRPGAPSLRATSCRGRCPHRPAYCNIVRIT